MSGRLIGGRYEIVRKIAEGGMGAVYEAQHHLSKKTVALKILFPRIGTDESARARFLREVSAPAQIGHDGIVEVLDAGFDTQDGSLFVAMEMLRGETMRERFARGLTRDQALDFFEAMLEPLAAAHHKGIVHRDLKPENVFVHRTRDGREMVKLLDFGIARDLDASSPAVTQTGIAMGTPHYMAPEQAMSARDVSYPADIWAAGAMIYEALSGAPPFGGDTASEIVVHAVSQPHEPLHSRAPTTPPEIAALVDRCLDKDPTKRPANAAQLLSEIRIARRTSPPVSNAHFNTPAPTPTLVEHPSAPIQTPAAPAAGKRRWILVALGVAVLGMTGLVATIAIAAVFMFRGDPSSFLSSTGVVQVSTTIPGELFVDGERYGTTTPSGTVLSLPAGPHTFEVRLAGAPLASRRVDIVSGREVRIELIRGAFEGTASPPSTPVAGVHQGTLAAGDHTLSTGEFADSYEYTWNAGQHVRIELSSSSFDSYLILRYPSGRQEDNDDANGVDAMLERTLDETGTYRVLVTSFRPGEAGPYTLTIR